MSESLDVRWVSDFKAEDVLASEGVLFDTANVPLSQIDWKASHTNCGRMGGALDEEKVGEMASAMERGDAFPMPILCHHNEGYVIPAGMHRCTAALKAGCTHVRCYRITLDLPSSYRLISVLTNSKEGDRETAEQRIEQVIALHRAGYDLNEAARKLNVPESTVRHRVVAESIKDKLLEYGNSKVNKVTRTSLSKLNKLDNVKVMSSLVDIAADCNLTSEELAGLVKDIKGLPSETQKLAHIEKECDKRNRTSETMGMTLKTRTKFLRSLSGLKNVVRGKSTLEDLQIVRGSQEHGDIKNEWSQLRKKLDQIIGRMRS